MSSHSRQETREGQTRAISKDYYYIDFHATIDAIKYRIFHLTEKVKDLYKPSQEKKDYHCPRCRAQWTQLEVLDKISPRGDFLCHRCDGVLERDDVSAADMAGHERQSKLYAQLEPLLQLMPLIDAQNIPQNDFDTAYSHAVPIIRNEEINPVRKTEPVDPTRPSSAAVQGMTQLPAAPLEVSLTTTSERAAADRAAAQRKADLAAQNALPVWHTNSTVTGETTALGNKERERLNAGLDAPIEPTKEEPEEKKEGNVLNDELEAYYAQMAQEREKEAQEDQEADSSEAEDDEFEDVGIGASGVGTPSSGVSGAANGSKEPSTNGLLNGCFGAGGPLLKRESESESSAPGTSCSTPAASGTVAEDGGQSPAKRIKLDPETNGEEAVVPLDRTDKVDKDSDEDEAEFEDAL
jgi:transcription initiation factor TFIIE subunit alpha